jgi:hypothetical protein
MYNSMSVVGTRALVAALAITSAACGGYSKETVPLHRDRVGMRIPNQQRLLALSTDEAVGRLNFKGLAGKKVVIEMAGIFPNTREDVLGYVQGQVEGKIARDGGLVISAGQSVVASADGSAAEPGAKGTISLTPRDADYRVIIGVSWAGVDTHDRKVVNKPLLMRQLAVMAAGVGLAVFGPQIVNESRISSESAVSWITVGVGLSAAVGGVIWYYGDDPTLHIYRLLGRVRVSVNAIPIVPGGTPFQTIGEGQTELLVDPTAEEGYILQ